MLVSRGGAGRVLFVLDLEDGARGGRVGAGAEELGELGSLLVGEVRNLRVDDPGPNAGDFGPGEDRERGIFASAPASLSPPSRAASSPATVFVFVSVMV